MTVKSTDKNFFFGFGGAWHAICDCRGRASSTFTVSDDDTLIFYSNNNKYNNNTKKSKGNKTFVTTVTHRSMTKLSQPTTETLYDLLERSNQKSRVRNNATAHPNQATNNPTNAVWDFRASNGTNPTAECTTGVSFIDTALSLHDDESKPIVIDISGDRGTGKTATIVTLAARFLFMTRHYKPSNDTTDKKANDPMMSQQRNEESSFREWNEKSMSLPQVILFDDYRNVTSCARRVYDVLGSMIRSEKFEMNQEKENRVITVDDNGSLLHNEVTECLQRLHVARVEDFPQWVLLLETLRHEMSYQQQLHNCCGENYPTTLLLWDDFLDEVVLTTPSVVLPPSFHTPSSSLSFATNKSYHHSTHSEITAIRMNVIRQVERLLQEYPQNTILVTTSTSSTTTTHHSGVPKHHRNRVIGKEWIRFVTHSIHLERCVGHSMEVSATPSRDGNHSESIPNGTMSSALSLPRQRNNSQLVWFATITKRSNNSGNITPPEPRQEHIVSFSISMDGIVT
jgi:hypothetical protein